MNALPLLSLCALLTLPASALAQSVNIDVGTGSLPSSGYGAASGLPGNWNSVSAESLSPVLLVDLSGTPTAATAQPINGQGNFSANNPNTSGDDQQLLDDTQDVGFQGSGASWVITGLINGNYKVYTYAWAPDDTSYRTLVSISGASGGSQLVGGVWTGSHTQGVTYALHTLTVASGTITVNVSASVGYGSVNGIQVVKLADPSPFTNFCPGDGSGTACPCGNSGAPGKGCENSASTGGAQLTAAGTVNPDTVVLTATGELPTSLTIFLQGDANAAPGVIFGDGIRCAGGTLKRLYSKQAVGGTVSAPGGGDLGLRAQAAALGDTILPGATRYYQTYYRDSNPSFCAAPPGNTYNSSSAVSIVWP